MRRPVSHILAYVVILGASACNQAEVAGEEQNQKAQEPTPLYDQRDGDVYMYIGEVSPEAKSRGESAPVFNVRYLGLDGNAHRLEFVDDAGRREWLYECSSPCRVAKVTANDGSVSKSAVNQFTIGGNAFSDALNGFLKVSEMTAATPPSVAAAPLTGIDGVDGGLAVGSGRASAIAPPNITGEWRNYRTRISDGWTTAPTLGGRYVVIEVGCGAGCRWAMVGDHQTGQINGLGLGGEDQMFLDLKFDDSSNRIRASWSDSDTGSCASETYTWTGSSLRSSGDKSLVPRGDSFSCS